MPQTKGRLVPGKITNLSTGEIAYFMFNPTEYSISKSNSWERKDKKGQNTPSITFKQGGPATLKLQLFFDTYMDDAREDVRGYTEVLWKMMAIDKTKKNPRTNKSDPPLVAFEWGGLYFEAVITQMSEKFTLFSQNGTPLRSTVDITLQQVKDPEDYRSQSTATVPAETAKSMRASLSSRLDQIAASSTGSASNYRSIAEANNIDDPRKVPPGTTLSIPNS
ncbi:MAG: hypothetical protein CUN55_00800 [Phototrophicales bacterium]|nr:MAG: hypothetical protein CUN55_00800 [Phototrophicales bacterium]